MLQLTDYDRLVLLAFESLRREIKDAEDYTIAHYNKLVADRETSEQVGQKEQDKIETKSEKTEEK